MNDVPPSPHSPVARYNEPFAEVEMRIYRTSGKIAEFREVLDAFADFLAVQERVTLSKNQLKVLRGQSVLVLERAAAFVKSGGDISVTLPTLASTFLEVRDGLVKSAEWEKVMDDPNGFKKLEKTIGESFESLEEQLAKLKQFNSEESIYAKALVKARQEDRTRTENLTAIIQKMSWTTGSLKARIHELIEENIRILGDSHVTQQQVVAKVSLSIIADLTGISLPPRALLGKDFVTMGSQAVNQGSSYDIFLGEYFTGEKIAIKVLRHRVDEATAQRTHLHEKRFARQALNWSALRHEAILPFYGVGVTPSGVADGEFQLYMVSPYLQNQDARRYLRKYKNTPLSTRIQMVLDVARGLHYMHGETEEPSLGIVHSSLNIFNILIKDSGRAVISGFGHSKVMEAFQESFTGDNTEYHYMAPEMLDDDPHFTYGSDIWSWAMTSLEILTDIPPFGEKAKGATIVSLIARGKQPSRNEHPKIEQYACREEIWQLFQECWSTEPSARPRSDQIANRLGRMLIQVNRRWARTAELKAPISSHMTAREIVGYLAEYGCQDVTNQLDLAKCDTYPIAGGGFGDVYKGAVKDGSIVAIKRPRIFVQSDEVGRSMLKDAAREMYAWSKLMHPNVMEVLGHAFFLNSLVVVSSWMEGGTVLAYVNNNPDADRCSLCSQVCNGLAYMHRKQMVHGDLKGINILVSKEGTAKISDFGNTTMKKYTMRFTGKDFAHSFSLQWAAPELVQDQTGHTTYTDIFALGMTILETITGKLPFAGKSDVAIYGAIIGGIIPPRPQNTIPSDTKDGNKLWSLITQCCKSDPARRPTAEQVNISMASIKQERLYERIQLSSSEQSVAESVPLETGYLVDDRSLPPRPGKREVPIEEAMSGMYLALLE